MEKKYLEVLIYIKDRNFRDSFIGQKDLFKIPHKVHFTYDITVAIEYLNSKTFDIIITEFGQDDNFIYDILIYKIPVILIIDPQSENILLPSIFNQISEIVSRDDKGNYIKLIPLYIDKIYREKYLDVKKMVENDRNSEILNKNFLAVISHELRTPLNSILGFASLLIDEERDSRKKEKLKIIKDSGKYLANLINDILDLSKIENGKLKIENLNFLLVNSLKHIESIFSVTAMEKSIRFVMYIDPSVPNIIFSDELRINQVMINILTNAFKFTPESGVITAECFYESGILKIVVSDTGIGIPQEKLNSIFNPFEQADESIGKKYGGSGLGLSITKRILELMNGNIKIASEAGKGTAVTIELPVQILNQNSNEDETADELEIPEDDTSASEKMIYGWIESLGDKKLRGILLDAIKKLPDKIHALEKSIREHNKDDMRFFIHKLKGFSGSFHMAEIYKTSCAMYDEIKNENYDIEKIKKYLTGLQETVRLIPEYYFKKQDFYMPVENKKIKFYSENARILITEDSVNSQKLIKAILEKVNIKCNFADNGKIALKMLREQKYEILLLDIFMPEMDGIEAIKLIRGDEVLKDIYVIALTADDEQSNKMKLLESGFDDCLFKPVEKYELISKVLSRLN